LAAADTDGASEILLKDKQGSITGRITNSDLVIALSQALVADGAQGLHANGSSDAGSRDGGRHSAGNSLSDTHTRDTRKANGVHS
jgi:hypothetical protein